MLLIENAITPATKLWVKSQPGSGEGQQGPAAGKFNPAGMQKDK